MNARRWDTWSQYGNNCKILALGSLGGSSAALPVFSFAATDLIFLRSFKGLKAFCFSRIWKNCRQSIKDFGALRHAPFGAPSAFVFALESAQIIGRHPRTQFCIFSGV
eukprot:1392622-Amorphochlora_amoeboformis.AAC.2